MYPLFTTYLRQWRSRLKRKLTSKPSGEFWQKTPLNSPDIVYQEIIKSIDNQLPMCVARVGSVESEIILWSQNITIPCYPFGKWRTSFDDTISGVTNAGIRPRSRDSYQQYGQLAFDALDYIDHWAVWCTNYEAVLINQCNHKPSLCELEILAPTMQFSSHWIDALNTKRILIVSPFQDSIQHQIPKLIDIWPSRQWLINSKITFYKFPYLIDDNCLLNWWDVYNEIATILTTDQYDVALFGCGGLGLPLAALAKKSGKIGIHLGGHLQLLFGIYGNRHLEQEWHKSCINGYWIRPLNHEVAQTANRLEKSCYW